jgi:hypothetical protein
VDPLLLVSSKSKGPPRPRQFPTQKQPRPMKVCLHDTACAWHEVPDLLHSPSFSPDSKALRLNLFNWRRWRRLEENELGRLRRHLHARLDRCNGVKVQSLFVSQIFLEILRSFSNFLRNFSNFLRNFSNFLRLSQISDT